MTTELPFFPYKLFFFSIEPVSALAGAYYAALRPSEYLHDLVAPSSTIAGMHAQGSAADIPLRMTLYQLANLHLIFALNEGLVLSSTSSLSTWRRLLLCLLVADFGHLATMAPPYSGTWARGMRWPGVAWGSSI